MKGVIKIVHFILEKKYASRHEIRIFVGDYENEVEDNINKYHMEFCPDSRVEIESVPYLDYRMSFHVSG